jgi:hypothetical protein
MVPYKGSLLQFSPIQKKGGHVWRQYHMGPQNYILNGSFRRELTHGTVNSRDFEDLPPQKIDTK